MESGRTGLPPLTVLRFEDNSQFQPAPSIGGGAGFWSSDGAELIQNYMSQLHRVSADGSSEPVKLASLGGQTVSPRKAC